MYAALKLAMERDKIEFPVRFSRVCLCIEIRKIFVYPETVCFIFVYFFTVSPLD